ncbi:MAG: response regulator transcription factor [Myxococcales bacterium]|nr:response regulator transcription factor [Myxococcales bacterium]
MQVLVVDDDPELAELVRGALVRDGHVVHVAADAREARDAFASDPDVIVLDIGLPDDSGLDLCRELRAEGRTTPVLLLTAQSAVARRVEGLDAGADDYVTKPFAVAELRARVRALGRRRERPAVTVVEVGDVALDLGRRRARRDELDVELTLREWNILEALAARHRRIVPRDVLLEEVWGEVTPAAGASLEVLVGRIRRKLGREVIRTERGVGYALG